MLDVIVNNDSEIINYISRYILLENYEIFVLSSFLLFYFFKTIFLSYLSFEKTFFAANLQKFTSQKLYDGYLLIDWQKYLNKKSSEQIRNITQEATLFSQVVGAYILFITELVVLLSIVIFLFIYNFQVTFVVVLLTSFFSLIIFLIPRNKLKIWGQQRQIHENKKIKFIQYAFGAFKEIKVLSLQDFFMKNFIKHNLISANVNAKNGFVSQLPRLLLEFFGVFCICGSAILLIYFKKDYTDILSLIILYSVAGIRLLPSFTKIIFSLQKIRFSLPNINLIYEELLNLRKDNFIISNSKLIKNKKIEFKNNIQIKNLFFSYDKSEKIIINNISLDINFGEAIGIIGPSGSGKSTLIDLIIGLNIPQSGSIEIDGINIKENINSWYSNIGYIPQNIFLLDGSIKSNIAFGVKNENIDQKKLNLAIEKSNLKSFIESLEDGVDTLIGELGNKISGGQKQRLGIARALYTDAKLLILDESTSSLDNQSEKKNN